MTPQRVDLPDSRVWLRVADPSWADPLDTSWSKKKGGRWNPPGAYATLYLNGDVGACNMQIERMLADSPVTPEDLDDGAYNLVAVTLPRSQTVADAASDSGLKALGLPVSYPVDRSGKRVAIKRCQTLGVDIRAKGLRGVWCRSAAGRDGTGRELAWFPAGLGSRARSVWESPKPYGIWRHARAWDDLALAGQPDPSIPEN